MKYYKLSMDMERENDIICHFQNDYGIQQNALNTGKVFENWDDRFEFFYTKEEGDVWTDYLANDKGWFLVSNRLKTLLESVNMVYMLIKRIAQMSLSCQIGKKYQYLYLKSLKI